MQVKAAVLMVGLAFCLSACYSDFPIDPAPQAELDAILLGTWRCLPADPRPDTDPLNYVVSTARRGVYAIRLEVKDEEPLLLEAYFSVVKGQRLLNVRDLDPKLPARPWLYARYSLPFPNVLRVQIVQEDLFKSAEQTPAGYRRVLEGLASASSGYEDYAVCIRARAGGTAWN